MVPPTPKANNCAAFILAPLLDAILRRKSQEDNHQPSAVRKINTKYWHHEIRLVGVELFPDG
jgi:hypothetical protein